MGLLELFNNKFQIPKNKHQNPSKYGVNYWILVLTFWDLLT